MTSLTLCGGGASTGTAGAGLVTGQTEGIPFIEHQRARIRGRSRCRYAVGRQDFGVAIASRTLGKRWCASTLYRNRAWRSHASASAMGGSQASTAVRERSCGLDPTFQA
ncbi:hypothetical protein BU26DRAFT_178565 [Trematosphaeria pertusa]|uniref:Uncharacterized protein n=1 Tax=Trematosphaeria pertusa TaxID=390896 RepID=A0A6A6HUN1_9PLEO|nr:uncharacterized protein BU26DRAFT_178565 [Trematosphaeria pertusa]KAF2241472.1 hypothetical protein BU26DRAFT_178565 [Trematosphaeria pertusa]